VPRFRAIVAVLAAALAATCATEPPTQPDPAGGLAAARGNRHVPGRLLVQFRPGADRAALAGAHGAALGGRVALGIELLQVPAGKELELAARLGAHPGVAFAEPDWLRTLDDPLCPACELPDDGFFGYKWDLHNDGSVNAGNGSQLAVTGSVDADIDWLEAFDLLGSGFGGTARVAILDTGVRTTHEDLAGRVVAQHDFFNDDEDATDDQGHGTHVAGIAAARGANARGLSGVAYGAGIGIVAAKVCNPTLFGLNAECPSSAIVAAITWAVDNGADVINLSLGGSEASEAERVALQYARAQGVLAVCAAGNSAEHAVLFPAAFPECVAVTATDWGDELASYSNWGPEVLLAAPGGDSENGSGYSQIASTCFGNDTNYCLKAGTSMAAPQVAGLAALLYATGLADDDAVLQRLQETADDLGDPGWDERFGHGRVNAHRAVQGQGGGTGNAAPAADFSSACTGASCTFTDGSSDSDGTIVTWSWSFGDGATSSERNPTHAYACGGSYTVALTVTDDGGAAGSTTRAVTVSGSGGGAGVPASIPDLALWLRADALTAADGDGIATWPDLSGSCRHATQTAASKRPVYRAAQINGLAALFFDASDDGMSAPLDPGVPVTIVTVYASRAGTTGYLLNGGHKFFLGPYVGRYRNYTSGYANGPPVEPGRWVVHALRQSPGRSELWIDGAFQASIAKNADPTGVWLGREGTYGKILDGLVAEVLVYARALSDAELQALHDALLDEYAAPPVSNLPPTASFASSCVDLACAFTDASTDPDGAVTAWSWTFGDGGTSAARNPTHTYAAAGTYTVTLIATDDGGATASANGAVTVTAAAGGSFEDPSSLAGLRLWLSADALTGAADGDPVATWPDGSGAGADATQAVASKRPLFRAAQVHGLPAVQFDAADDGMATPVDPGVPVTIFVVYASRAGATGHVLNGGFSFFMGPYVGRYRNYTGAYANGPTIAGGRWLLQTLRQSSSLAELFVDGVFQASVSKTANPAAIALAAQGTYGQPLDGLVAEVIVYDRALTEAERGDVEGWLRARYALF